MSATGASHLLGLRTVIYHVPDLHRAIADPFGNVIGLIENPHFVRDAVR